MRPVQSKEDYPNKSQTHTHAGAHMARSSTGLAGGAVNQSFAAAGASGARRARMLGHVRTCFNISDAFILPDSEVGLPSTVTPRPDCKGQVECRDKMKGGPVETHIDLLHIQRLDLKRASCC